MSEPNQFTDVRLKKYNVIIKSFFIIIVTFVIATLIYFIRPDNVSGTFNFNGNNVDLLEIRVASEDSHKWLPGKYDRQISMRFEIVGHDWDHYNKAFILVEYDREGIRKIHFDLDTSEVILYTRNFPKFSVISDHDGTFLSCNADPSELIELGYLKKEQIEDILNATTLMKSILDHKSGPCMFPSTGFGYLASLSGKIGDPNKYSNLYFCAYGVVNESIETIDRY